MNKRWINWIGVGVLFLGFYIFTASPISNNDHTMMFINRFSFLSALDLDLLGKIIRKTAHLLSFGVLALTIRNALHPHRWAYPGAWLLATLYGASDEIHQMFVPGRTPLFSDVMIDSLGAFLTLYVLYFLKMRKENRFNIPGSQ